MEERGWNPLRWLSQTNESAEHLDLRLTFPSTPFPMGTRVVLDHFAGKASGHRHPTSRL